MFVALSQFKVADGMAEPVRRAFRERPHLVDSAPGFRRMEVLSPVDDASEFWLMTFWDDAESFRAWHRSHAYHASHRGIPAGLKLVPRSVRITHLEHVAS